MLGLPKLTRNADVANVCIASCWDMGEQFDENDDIDAEGFGVRLKDMFLNDCVFNLFSRSDNDCREKLAAISLQVLEHKKTGTFA